MKISAGEPFKRPYRYVMMVLLLLVPLCTMVPYVAPAVFMGQIMQTFQVDMSMAGLTMTIQLGATGLCMFIGSMIQDRLGSQKTMILSIWAMAVGNAIAGFAGGIGVFLAARFLAGFGQGLYSTASNVFFSTWYDGKERTFILTANNIVNSIFLAIAYSIGLPLCNWFGGWQKVFVLYAAVIAAIAVIWTLFGKASPEAVAAEQARTQPQADKAGQSALVRAMKEPEYWKLAIFVSIVMMANTSIATYLPTYLTTERGMDASVATTVSSLNSLLGMAGSLLGGVLCAQLWRRKPILLVSGIAYILVGLGITTFSAAPLVMVLALSAGALYFVPTTAQSTMMIEAKKPFDPTILGGAASIIFGFGQLLCVAVSFIFSAIASASSMTIAYRVLFAACILGIVSVVSMKETGTRPQKVQKG